ncbi:MAG: DUF3987 domain-containing protein [Pseudomonadota bacterium]
MSLQAYHRYMSEQNWGDPDLSVLDERRGPVPAVPLALLPLPWRDWIAEAGQATGTPVDYVLQSVLAGVAAVCGAGVRVRVTPAWDEPLVLWLAAVGDAATGKSAALAPMRWLLASVEQELQTGDTERRSAHDDRVGKGAETMPFVPTQLVTDDADPAVLAAMVAAHPRGLLLWRDGPAVRLDGAAEDDAHGALWRAAWEARGATVARPRQPALAVGRFAVSIVAALRPQPLRATLQKLSQAGGDDGLAARFLYAWPGPQPYRALAVVDGARDAEILRRLRALAHLGGGADDPCVIEVDARGRAALDGVLATLHAERREAEGVAASWLGASRSLIVRLAGVLELMASIDGTVLRPGAIGAEQVEAAAALWRDYFRPHARAVFDSAELSEPARRVRRVARWLLAHRPPTVSREEIRRRALGLSATADETQSALERLAYLGFVKPELASHDKPGRPPNRWVFNPVLANAETP